MPYQYRYKPKRPKTSAQWDAYLAKHYSPHPPGAVWRSGRVVINLTQETVSHFPEMFGCAPCTILVKADDWSEDYRKVVLIPEGAKYDIITTAQALEIGDIGKYRGLWVDHYDWAFEEEL